MHYKTPDVDGIGNKRLNLITLQTAIMKYQEEELSLITYSIYRRSVPLSLIAYGIVCVLYFEYIYL